MTSLLKHLPNAMTCGNLLCGCVGLYAVLQNPGYGLLVQPGGLDDPLLTGSFFILIAAVLDFLDGFVARLLKVQSAIGKELDSLADMVTFGVLPAFMMLRLVMYASFGPEASGEIVMLDGPPMLGNWSLLALSLAVFSALRLAKFNVDTRQTDQFIGVPTPANALVIASLPAILAFQKEYSTFIMNPYVLFGYVALMSYLMVSEIPLMAFKFKTFAWADNQIKYIFLGVSALLLLFLQFAALPLIVGLYIVFSLLSK